MADDLPLVDPARIGGLYISPSASKRGMKAGRPRIPGTTCSSQPLDEKQEECKRLGNNVATKEIISGATDSFANLRRALTYCGCMGALDTYSCTDALLKIGWQGYL